MKIEDRVTKDVEGWLGEIVVVDVEAVADDVAMLVYKVVVVAGCIRL